MHELSVRGLSDLAILIRNLVMFYHKLSPCVYSYMYCRVWNADLEKWDVTGEKDALQTSAAYPLSFGRAIVGGSV